MRSFANETMLAKNLEDFLPIWEMNSMSFALKGINKREKKIYPFWYNSMYKKLLKHFQSNKAIFLLLSLIDCWGKVTGYWGAININKQSFLLCFNINAIYFSSSRALSLSLQLFQWVYIVFPEQHPLPHSHSWS